MRWSFSYFWSAEAEGWRLRPRVESISAPLPFQIKRGLYLLFFSGQCGIYHHPLLASFFISPIQLPLNLDQIACSGRFSSPHLAKRLSRKKILRTLWKVSSLLMISEMAGFGKSTLALSQLLSSHKVSILVFDLKVGIYHSISNYLKDSN